LLARPSRAVPAGPSVCGVDSMVKLPLRVLYLRVGAVGYAHVEIAQTDAVARGMGLSGLEPRFRHPAVRARR